MIKISDLKKANLWSFDQSHWVVPGEPNDDLGEFFGGNGGYIKKLFVKLDF